jgi:type IV pilus assembly protein PilV
MRKQVAQDRKSREQGLPASGVAGFTLIEVLIAIVILTVGLLAVGTMQISAIRGNFMGGNTSIALSLASEKMEDLLNSDFNDPPGVQKLADRISGNNSDLSSTTNVDYEEPVSDDGVVGAGGFYRRVWNVADVPTGTPTTKNVMVIVTWESNKHRVSIASIKNQVVY